ncbi:DUF4386 family protein [Devosia sp. J2-20]|uniref:DUF4386 family protein n=1 Tax=Devosia sp. J2-20 TaxID=3026161 RepID=UPI00249B3325|nr:DUF4386 family protein [Devosia sp. J2-20]WDQ98660.1 DUF4386 family protein [Devosia sp. J2-20]
MAAQNTKGADMFSLQKWGAAAGFGAAATYIFGFILLLTVLAGSGYGMADADPASVVSFVINEQTLMTSWYTIIYVVNGFLVALLAVALADIFKPHAPTLSSVVQVFGALWATLVVGAGMVANVGKEVVATQYASDPEGAVLMWQIFSGVENGLGGGNEIAGAVWAMVVGAAMLRTALMPKPLGCFSLVIGVSGLLTLIPALNDTAGSVFGLGYIAWFVWVGFVLLNRKA